MTCNVCLCGSNPKMSALSVVRRLTRLCHCQSWHYQGDMAPEVRPPQMHLVSSGL